MGKKKKQKEKPKEQLFSPILTDSIGGLVT